MKLDQAHQIVVEFLANLGFKADDIVIEERSDGEYYVNIVTPESVALIGHSGEVLLALQHLVKSIFRQQGAVDEKDHVKIDVDSYRIRQEKNVTDMADRCSLKVIEASRQIALPPMSSFFRRLVHVYVKEKYPQLTTFSQGDGNYRSVMIALAETEEIPESSDLYHDLDL